MYLLTIFHMVLYIISDVRRFVFFKNTKEDLLRHFAFYLQSRLQKIFRFYLETLSAVINNVYGTGNYRGCLSSLKCSSCNLQPKIKR